MHKGKLTNVNPPRITTEPFWDWVVGTFLGGMLYDLTFHTGETIESFNAGRDAANAMWNK